MQIITGELDGHTNEYPFSRIGNRDDILLLDIETTGLSPEHAQIYLIGCAYWEEDHWRRIQWFDETGRGEADILTSFLLFSKKYSVLLHYNGQAFDLPFLTKRIVHNGLQSMSGAKPFPEGMKSVDLYCFLKPYQKILSLPDLRQQTVEQFMGTGRTESSSGKDLISCYLAYAALSRPGHAAEDAAGAGTEVSKGTDTASRRALRSAILEHNAADLQGLLSLSIALAYADLFSANVSVYKAQANTCRNADGEPMQELIMYARAEGVPEDIMQILTGNHSADPGAESLGNADPAPSFITAQADGCYVSICGNKVTLKVPIYNGRIRYYYANYKDYYYLPELDQAVHKSIATFVDRDRRQQASARTCYTAKVGAFLPEWSRLYEPVFKKEYEDKDVWFEFTDDKKKDRAFFSGYASYVYHHIMTGRRT